MECVVAFFERLFIYFFRFSVSQHIYRSAELLTMPVGDQAVIKRVPHVENSRCFCEVHSFPVLCGVLIIFIQRSSPIWYAAAV